VPQIHDGNHAYILQNDDGRVVFIIPFEGRYSLIGTTEVEVEEPGGATISEDETRYLCRAVDRYLARPVKAEDVVWSYAGLRSLFADGEGSLSAITRDYELDVDAVNGTTPALTVYGGKITTYRRLAEHVLDKLRPFLPHMREVWTDSTPMPGGDIPNGDVSALVTELTREYSTLPLTLHNDLAYRHGTLARELLGEAGKVEDLGEHFGAGLYAREVDYLIEQEWAQTADDILWRRTKAGLHMSNDERAQVQAYMASQLTVARTNRN
jgi:glycerol-3-phosphate dehydrogenase